MNEPIQLLPIPMPRMVAKHRATTGGQEFLLASQKQGQTVLAENGPLEGGCRIRTGRGDREQPHRNAGSAASQVADSRRAMAGRNAEDCRNLDAALSRQPQII